MTHPFMPLAEHAIRHITVVLAADQRLIAASLMGSALSARFRPDSDVDVALLPKPGPRLSALDLADLAAPLEEVVGHRSTWENCQLDTTVLRGVAETRWQDLVQFFREIQIKIQP